MSGAKCDLPMHTCTEHLARHAHSYIGIAFALLCRWRAGPPARLTITDANASALANAQHNLSSNGVPVASEEGDTYTAGHHGVHVKLLRWEDIVDDEHRVQQDEAELLIAADVLYDVDALPSLARAIAFHLHAVPSARAIVACALRSEETLLAFKQALHRVELCLYDNTNLLWPNETGRFHHIPNDSGERDIVHIYTVHAFAKCTDDHSNGVNTTA